MRKRISVVPVVAVLACMVLAFLWQSGQLQKDMDEVERQYEQSRVKLTELQSLQTELKETLEKADSDEFIENQARTRYGYMKPDEIRFVITNPEALYGANEPQD